MINTRLLTSVFLTLVALVTTNSLLAQSPEPLPDPTVSPRT